MGEVADRDTSQYDSTMHNSCEDQQGDDAAETEITRRQRPGETSLLFVYCEWLSSALVFATTKVSHLPLESGLVGPVVEIVSHSSCLPVACGRFQSDDIHYMFQRSQGVCEELVFPPLVPSLFWCAFWLSSPRPDRLADPKPNKAKIDLPSMFYKARFFDWLEKW